MRGALGLARGASDAAACIPPVTATEPARHRTTAELEAGLEEILRAPKEHGTLDLIVCRPDVGRRAVLASGELDLELGLVGDSWHARTGARHGGRPSTDTQVTVMNSRAARLVAVDEERWPLAGDQLYVDLDLSVESLSPGARLEVGEAVIEVTAAPHTGCKKFVERFGADAMTFVNSPVGRALRLRGVNTRVVAPGAIRAGDAVRATAAGGRA